MGSFFLISLGAAIPTKINRKDHHMSESTHKYPKAVKAIYIAGSNGESGHKIDVDSSESEMEKALNQSYRDWDREVRAMSLSAAEFFKTYADLHSASNEETENGSLKHFSKNAIKAHKAAFQVFKKHSKVFDYDPTEIHDKMVECLEELEEQAKED